MRDRLAELRGKITALEKALDEQETVEDTISLIGSCAPWLEVRSPRGTVLINTPEARACLVESLEWCLDDLRAHVNRLEKELDSVRNI